MKIYVADVRAIAGEEVFLEKCKLLPEERRKQIWKLQNFQDKLRGVGAGLLLEYGLRQHGLTLCDNVEDKTRVSIVKGPYGKPYLADTEGVYFNLSHSGDYVAAVFATCEAGIDIERSRTANFAVARRFFTKEEYAYLEKVCLEGGKEGRLDLEFARLWTRKESYIKAVGEGMHLPLADFCVLSDTVGEDMTYRLKTWMLPDGFVLSVCAKEQIEAEFAQIDLMKII